MNTKEPSVQQTHTEPNEEVVQPVDVVKDDVAPVSAEEPQAIVEEPQENLSTQSTIPDNGENVSSVQPPVTCDKKEPNIIIEKISNIYNKFIEKLNFDEFIYLKKSIIQYLSKCPYICELPAFKQSHNYKPIATNIDFIPYYFLTSHFKDDYLKRMFFENNVTDIIDLLPYKLALQNSEIKLDAPKNAVTPQGTTDTLVLINAPSPQIEVLGKSLYAKLVIDIRNNTLYKYDKDGFPLKAYLVATGARGTRTLPGLRIVTHKERFPYIGAPNSKRALDPYSYGPYIIFINQINPVTGRQSSIGQLLHGNGNEYSIGKKVSHGCIRTNNNVMRNELSKEVKRGDYILLINPDIN